MYTKEDFYLQYEDSNFDSLTNDLLFKEAYSNPQNRKALEHLLETCFNYPDGFLKNKLAVNYESVFRCTLDLILLSSLVIVDL